MKRYKMRGRDRILETSRSEFIRWQLPYGCYHCVGGREVLYDRNYSPLCERSPGVLPGMADPDEWIADIIRHEWFYDDTTPELKKRKIGEAKLVEWGMLVPVMAGIEEAIRNSEYFSWKHRMWRSRPQARPSAL